MCTENLGSTCCGPCGDLGDKKLGHKDEVLFQPQNCAAYVEKNQLQKCYQEINSEQEPGTQAFLKFLFNSLLQETAEEKGETTTE